MRIGQNPEKAKEQKLVHKNHRVIVPVFIPEETGFFEHSYSVFLATMNSLFSTVGNETNITVIDNNSIDKVAAQCQDWQRVGKIDRFIQYGENRGKAEAVLAAARGSWEEFITVSDADILFKQGWVKQIAEAFSIVPKLGAIGLLTSPACTFRASSTAVLDSMLSLRLRIGVIVSDESIKEFCISTGLDGSKAEKEMLDTQQFYINVRGKKFLIGANHAAITYRRHIFFDSLDRKVEYPFRRQAKLIKNHFDIPSDRMGYWRLSFQEPMAYHLGNTISSNEEEKLQELLLNDKEPRDSIEFPTRREQRSWMRFLPYSLRNKVVFWFLKAIQKFFPRKKDK